jgi:hypothetical protein
MNSQYLQLLLVTPFLYTFLLLQSTCNASIVSPPSSVSVVPQEYIITLRVNSTSNFPAATSHLVAAFPLYKCAHLSQLVLLDTFYDVLGGALIKCLGDKECCEAYFKESEWVNHVWPNVSCALCYYGSKVTGIV